MFNECVTAIEDLCDPAENMYTRDTAQGLLTAVCDFTFLCNLHFWNEVNIAQRYMPTKDITLDNVVIQNESLKLFLKEKRNNIIEYAIEQALQTNMGFRLEKECGSKKEWQERKQEMLDSICNKKTRRLCLNASIVFNLNSV